MLVLCTIELARIGDELVDEDDARAAAVEELAELSDPGDTPFLSASLTIS